MRKEFWTVVGAAVAAVLCAVLATSLIKVAVRAEDYEYAYKHPYAVPAAASEFGVGRATKDETVGGIPVLDGELDLLTDIVWLEARGCSYECRRATAEAILNRVRCGYWGATITDVLMAVDPWTGYWEFSTVPLLGTVVRDGDWTAIREMIDEIFAEGIEIPVRVMYFRIGWYHGWANDEFEIDGVFFSSSPWLEV